MTDQPPLTPAQATRFVQALLELMVTHGLRGLEARQAGGQLGLSRPGQFETGDLTFHFMTPGEHRSAVQAYALPEDRVQASQGARTEQDIEPFVRAAGQLFDLHGVATLLFAAGGYLGFRANGPSREFVLDGITVRGQA
ncbi:hypothetical protein LAJ19_13970 (plasmid) [Deinococcus taeanensis]|uniref:hypothetical protein n=1 Tax=Deinococcus taeanensis TaxID=2737050 RepID=UPI001CDB5015|nr:hypothetical protein [Deinococcus taeanensis]UBV44278.1 hypothetical protein LAJ19_13970 [Deinococcus taeanensis]